jgi:AI-2 transport protein TqsA
MSAASKPAGADSPDAPSPEPAEHDRPAAAPGMLATLAPGPSSLRVLIGGASLVIIMLGMRWGRSVLNPALLGLIVTLAISPLLHAQVKRGVSPKIAYVTTLLATGIVGVFLALLMAASLARIVADIPTFTAALDGYRDSVVNFLAKLGVDAKALGAGTLDPSKVVHFGVDAAQTLISTLSSVVFIGFTVCFMLLEAMTISSKFASTGGASDTLKRMADFTSDVRGYVKVTVYLGALAAVLDTIVLVILGVPFAVFWGILSFILSFIPYIGFFLALVPPAFFALASHGWVSALIVVFAYIAINTVTDSILKPGAIGKHTNLSPLWVFLSLFLWGFVLGPVGTILSVPVTLMMRTLFLEGYAESRWLAQMMAEAEKPPKPPSRWHLPRRRRPRSDTEGEAEA